MSAKAGHKHLERTKRGAMQSATVKGKIHPIIIYPFSQPKDQSDLLALYRMAEQLSGQPAVFHRPITVMNRQTYYNNLRWTFDDRRSDAFRQFREDVVAKNSVVVDAWCVDTCQMWLTGFGAAYDVGNPADDVYWLIPGDFDYASEHGQRVVEKILDLPKAVLDHDQDIALGEIHADVNSSKQLIDTYGTYGLLYNWFPHEAKEIRRKTDKPRSEFFAIGHGFLREVLRQRWYAYEQTIVILLQAVIGKKRIHVMQLGEIVDIPQGRDSLTAAMQQVERTERVLKLFWRERNQNDSDWAERFKKLDVQSGQIRGSALVILENLLTYP